MQNALTLNNFSCLLLAKLANKPNIIDLKNRSRKICSIPSNYKQVIQDILSANENWKESFSCLIDIKSYSNDPYEWEKNFSDSLKSTIKKLNKTYSYNFSNDSIDIDFTQEEIDNILSKFSKHILEQMDHFSNLMTSLEFTRKGQELSFQIKKFKDQINER